jgi:ABC-2 type transport system permease protein
MNTPNIAMPGPSLSALPSAPRRISYTQSFYWSVRREIWENRSIYLIPLIAAAIFLFGFVINLINLRYHIRGVAWTHENFKMPHEISGALIMGSALIVGIFYSLEALYGERRDRSILFWKSLPVSDLTAVLAKLSIPLVVIFITSLPFTACGTRPFTVGCCWFPPGRRARHFSGRSCRHS